ncbi:MAG TPA: sensor histidine kinase [Pseudonocardiaceae bacterium]|nr:sensor histidine kinase [Pseudonocardiaceae bacterium]
MSRRTKLSTRILVSQVIILFVTMCIGFVLYSWLTSYQLGRQYQQRALSVAQAVAALPQVQQALLANDVSPASEVQTLTQRIQHGTGATFIVVINPQGIRLSHPLPELIGQRVTEPVHVMNGQTYVDVDPGSLGPSADGFAPVFGPTGHVLGEVSAGIQENQVSGAFNQQLLVIGLFTILTLGFGAVAALLLARQLKRITFGLELHEIARLLQEREAMLHGIREGVITFDPRGNVTLINDEARRLIGVRTETLGHPLDELALDDRLREVLSGEQPGPDQLVLTDEHSLVANRMSVRLGGRPLGAVVTLRDRTELDELLQELTSTRGLTDALRAQQHEFANRMHTVSGLLELGRADEALSFLAETTGAADGFAESVSQRIEHPVVAALIVAKATVATERAVTLLLSELSGMSARLPGPAMVQGIVTILGTLIDNAIDAASLGRAPAHVTVRLVQTEQELTIRVSDTGPGIPAGSSLSIFREGFSTKESVAGAGRGIGLSLVRRETRRMGGRIEVSEGPGSVFTVVLPTAVAS